MDPNIAVVIVAAEAEPYAKAGGLADAVGGLARALTHLRVPVTLVLPGYASIDRARFGLRRLPNLVPVQLPDRNETVSLDQGPLEGSSSRVLLINHDGYFGRAGIYTDPVTRRGFDDEGERYAFFCQATLAALATLGARVDVLHLHDYHPALISAYVRESRRVIYRSTATVLSIHNLGYQGIFAPDLAPRLGLPEAYTAGLGALEFWGRLNFLKAGIQLADLLTTVSPTYAVEIQGSDAYGYGLQDLLRARSNDLIGILNGIDADAWNPRTDRLIPARYDLEDRVGKKVCKHRLQERLGLEPEAGTPLLGVVARLVEQKGVDLLVEGLDRLMQRRVQLVVLGAGERVLEAQLQAGARRYPGRMAVSIGFDDELAHWIEAGSDFFLMPSRYEPCGLNQMYSLRYGTLPIVRRTGGLADTVVDAHAGRNGNGFTFEAIEIEAFLAAIDRALATYESPPTMDRLIATAMRADFSWPGSARRYLATYHLAAQRARAATRAEPRAAAGAGRPEPQEH